MDGSNPNIPTALDLAERDDLRPLNPDRPVYFVASQLRRSFPEIEPPDGSMLLAHVPRTRLHLIENTWIVSTYLRLKEAGLPVRISDRLQPDHVNICTDERLLRDPAAGKAFIVAVQADRGYGGWGDFTLCQSPAMIRGQKTCLIDHWPQPGLIPRDESRGDDIRRIGYFGYAGNLAAPYRDPSFARRLADIGVEWVALEDPSKWHDYSGFDLCLAVRDIPEIWIRTKPSTKLVHAWITGCPALLGPEPSYRFWGRPGEDYVEIRSPDEAVEWVDRLRSDPALYRRMIEQGKAQAPRHDEAAVLGQWEALLRRLGPEVTQSTSWAKRDLRLRRVAAAAGRRWFYLRAKGLRATTKGLARRFARRDQPLAVS